MGNTFNAAGGGLLISERGATSQNSACAPFADASLTFV